MLHLIQFKAEEIDKVWPLVKDKVQAACDRNDNFRDHVHVKEQCKLGTEQLWVIVDNNDDDQNDADDNFRFLFSSLTLLHLFHW